MKVLVVGAGALGCLFGSLLTLGGGEAALYDTDKAKVMLLDFRGVYLEENDGSLAIARTPAYSDIAAAGEVDVVLLLVKAYHTLSAAQSIAEAVSGEPDIITLQNGMGNIEALRRFFPSERLFCGATYQGAYELTPGNIIHTGSGVTFIAPLDEERFDAAEAYAALFTSCSIPTQALPEEEMDQLLWRKLLVNAAINPLSALYRLPNGKLAENDTAREEMRQLTEEGVAVANAMGIELEVEDIWQTVLATCRNTAANHSSMLVDVERGRRTEIDAINGSIINFAKRRGVSATAHQQVLRRFKDTFPEYATL